MFMTPAFRVPQHAPIVLHAKEGPFVCSECHRPGWGQVGRKAHPGKCREARTARLAAIALAKRKARGNLV